MKEINSAFSQVTDIIETAKNSAYKKINEELINMYWNIGAFLSKEAENAVFGDAYIDSIQSSNAIAKVGWLLPRYEGMIYDYRNFM